QYIPCTWEESGIHRHHHGYPERDGSDASAACHRDRHPPAHPRCPCGRRAYVPGLREIQRRKGRCDFGRSIAWIPVATIFPCCGSTADYAEADEDGFSFFHHPCGCRSHLHIDLRTEYGRLSILG